MQFLKFIPAIYKFGIALAVAIWSFIVLVFGKVWGQSEGEKERKKTNEENERLRKQIRSVLETFKKEMYKKDAKIKEFDKIIKSPPKSQKELRKRLQTINIDNVTIDRIMSAVKNIY